VGDSQNLLPSSSSELTIASFTIENQGYDSFQSNPTYFSAVVKGSTYNYDSSCYANNILTDAKIANGGTVQGNVTFKLPELTKDTDITWQYVGPGKYNIEWVNLEPRLPQVTQTTN
jgi:hypothetical protein